MAKCGMKCEVFTRVVGYHRPVSQWNQGKRAEFKDRVEFDTETSLKSNLGSRGYPKTEIELANGFVF